MVELYTWKTPNGRKAAIALEELGVEYEVHPIDLDSNAQLTPQFTELNPCNKIPVLVWDDTVIWESGAILLYLAEKTGKLLPQDRRRRMEATQHLFFHTGSVWPPFAHLIAQLVLPETERTPESVEMFAQEADRACGVMERLLSDSRPFLAGDYSIADIVHIPLFSPGLNLGFPQITERPNLVKWIRRVAARPAVLRGMSVPRMVGGASL